MILAKYMAFVEGDQLAPSYINLYFSYSILSRISLSIYAFAELSFFRCPTHTSCCVAIELRRSSRIWF